ncbi:PA14 domain-containing protein [Hymenobacter profundi]|uniref:RICIN domain-containing protein n=1 Tax=Hymenobacter profundi TaxID=1982110 RepID=A0ABS6X1H7_9BACT|nr:PA14 domain-containing protein [Hymenobacter profundi]MBW3129514.1 RICIN domain-containing protein [Hymenobacter profundi]
MMRHLLYCSLVGMHLFSHTEGAFASAKGAPGKEFQQLVAPAQNGTPGLTGWYFGNSTLAGKPIRQQQDAAPNFQWGKDAPAPTIPADYFSVRWEGFLTAPTTGSYSFAVRAGEQVRLWINGQKILDTWDGQSLTESDIYVNLAAGESTPIKLEYHSEEGDAHVQLQWTSPKQARQAIPAEAFSAEGFVMAAAPAPAPAVAQPKVAVEAPKQTVARKSGMRLPKGAVAAPAVASMSGVYRLKARNDGQTLAVAEQQATSKVAADAAAPEWMIESAGNGYYRVFVQGSNKALEVLGNSSSNGAALDLWPAYKSDNQLWLIHEAEDGYYSLVAKHSSKALTAKETSEGGLQQWRYNGGADQQWKLEPVVGAKVSTKATPLVGNGDYKVHVYPNPSNGISQLRYQLPGNMPVGWVLYDTRGVAVRSSDARQLTDGVHNQTLPFLELPNGNYQLHLTVNGVTTTQPVMIRHPKAEPQGEARVQTAEPMQIVQMQASR